MATAQFSGISSSAFQPDVVMFSGLHLLDSSTAEKQNEKLSALILQFAKLPKNLPIHLELASMANTGLVHLLATKVDKSIPDEQRKFD